MKMRKQNKIFAQSFRLSQEGHAVWPKILSTKVRPGTCGYVNGNGDWETIIQLCDASKEIASKAGDAKKDTCTALGLTKITGLGEEDDGGNTDWKDQMSEKIVGTAVQLDGKVLPPGAPASARAGVNYTCEARTGAILLANGPVTCSRLTGPVTMTTWVNENLDALVKLGNYKSIKKRGLWVVTTTYHAPECAKTVMQSRNQSASIHVGVAVPDAAEAKASASWWKAENLSSGWRTHRGRKDANSEHKPTDPEVVMFFGGFWWKPAGTFSRAVWEEEETEKQKYLGPDPNKEPSQLVPAPEDEVEEPNDAYLKLYPGAVGKTQDLAGFPEFEDTYMMYESDSESESE